MVDDPYTMQQRDGGESLKIVVESLADFVVRFSGKLATNRILIETDDIKPVGTKVNLGVKQANGSSLIDGTGVVFAVREPGNEGKPAGMAIDFIYLDSPSRALIDAMVKRQEKTTGTVVGADFANLIHEKLVTVLDRIEDDEIDQLIENGLAFGEVAEEEEEVEADLEAADAAAAVLQGDEEGEAEPSLAPRLAVMDETITAEAIPAEGIPAISVPSLPIPSLPASAATPSASKSSAQTASVPALVQDAVSAEDTQSVAAQPSAPTKKEAKRPGEDTQPVPKQPILAPTVVAAASPSPTASPPPAAAPMPEKAASAEGEASPASAVMSGVGEETNPAIAASAAEPGAPAPWPVAPPAAAPAAAAPVTPAPAAVAPATAPSWAAAATPPPTAAAPPPTVATPPPTAAPAAAVPVTPAPATVESTVPPSLAAAAAAAPTAPLAAPSPDSSVGPPAYGQGTGATVKPTGGWPLGARLLVAALAIGLLVTIGWVVFNRGAPGGTGDIVAQVTPPGAAGEVRPPSQVEGGATAQPAAPSTANGTEVTAANGTSSSLAPEVSASAQELAVGAAGGENAVVDGGSTTPVAAEPVAPEPENTQPAPVADPSAALLATVTGWSEAWAGQNVDAYLSFYGSSFRPANGTGRRTWAQQRRQRLTTPSFIKVRVESPAVEILGDDRAQVDFRQYYESDVVRDVVNKVLTLVREDGAWKIVREEVRG